MRKLIAAVAALVVCAAFSSTNANAGGCRLVWSLHLNHLVCAGYGGMQGGYHGGHGYGGNGYYGHAGYGQRTVVRHREVVVHRHYESGRYIAPRTAGCGTCGGSCAQAYVPPPPPPPVGPLCASGYHSVPPPQGHQAWCAPDHPPAPPPPQVILRSRG